MKKFMAILLMTCVAFYAHSQYFYSGPTIGNGNPGGLNTDDEYPDGGGMPAGWTIIQNSNTSSPTWSSTETIPFTFSFNGSPVTQYKASTTGVVTFTTSAPTPPVGVNVSLPN